MFFRFVEPGPMVDGELELLPPRMELIDEVMRSLNDPRTRIQMPREAEIPRQEMVKFVQSIPRGRQSGRRSEGRAPAYHFWMQVTGPTAYQQMNCPAVIAGGLALRVGTNQDIELYYGHVGYHVYPPSRSHHYAERSVRLVLPLAARHGLKQLWITCNPDNIASRRTCERLGAEFIEIVDVPVRHPLYLRGEVKKCRYRLNVGG